MASGKKHGWLKKKRVYSASSIKTFLNCELQAFYDKMHVPKLKIPTHPEYVRGNVLHGLMPKFHRNDGTPRYCPFSQKKLKDIKRGAKFSFDFEEQNEDMDLIYSLLPDYFNKDGTPKLSKRKLKEPEREKVNLILGESFANLAEYKLHKILEKGTYRNQKIDLARHGRLEDNLNDLFRKLEGGIYTIAKQVYKTYYKSELPVFAEKTITFSVKANDILLNYIAKLDEIRYPLTIRDHKSDYWLPEENSLSLNNDLQFSVYAIALSMGCSLNKAFALKCGASEEDFKLLQEDPLYLLPKINIEHHHMRTGLITSINSKLKKDFYKLINTSLEIEKKIAEYQKGEKHFLEIFKSKWGTDKHEGTIKVCEECDYRRYHERDQKLYEEGKSDSYESIQKLLPGFVYPEITPMEQIKLRFPRGIGKDIEAVLPSM